MKFFSSIAIAFALIGAVIFMSNQANASATGCDNRQYSDEAADPHAISVDIKFPYGYLCHMVHTRGKEIKEQEAAYTESAGIYAPLVKDICNWRIDFVYYDTNGEEYLRDEGQTVSDCKAGAKRKAENDRKLPHFGTTCAELIIEGERKYSQCYSFNE
jgi:hypothetical protein